MSGQNRRTVAAYTLRTIDPELWRKVKARAAYEGKTVRAVLLELLRAYAAHGDAVVEAFTKDQGGS